jgi:hypothetical protein
VVPLDETAFGSGSLPVTSYARPGKLFTASGDPIAAQVGVLTAEAMARIVDAVVTLLKAGTGPLPSPEAEQ